MKRLLNIVFALALGMMAWGQGRADNPALNGKNQPAITSKDSTKVRQEEMWFDPTRKQEKVKEVYNFSTDWRIEVGYVQNQQRSKTGNMMNPYLHGMKIGGTVDFNLPFRLSLQTGLTYTVTYGRIEQHWPASTIEAQHADGDYILHNIMEHQLGIPLRLFYRQPLWKKLSLVFYGGPKLEIGLAQPDYLHLHLTDTYGSVLGSKDMLEAMGVRTSDYDRYGVGDLNRLNVQMGVGGGIEWDQYRLQAGYDFGLNNLVKTKLVKDQHMWEWGWYVSFVYKF